MTVYRIKNLNLLIDGVNVSMWSISSQEKGNSQVNCRFFIMEDDLDDVLISVYRSGNTVEWRNTDSHSLPTGPSCFSGLSKLRLLLWSIRTITWANISFSISSNLRVKVLINVWLRWSLSPSQAASIAQSDDLGRVSSLSFKRWHTLSKRTSTKVPLGMNEFCNLKI